MGLLLTSGRVSETPVSPGDGLEQGVLAKWFVQIHRLLDRGIETGEQFRGDDEERERVVGVVEPRLHVRFLRPVQGVLGPRAWLLLTRSDGHHDRSLER